jgi:hypothetical protein
MGSVQEATLHHDPVLGSVSCNGTSRVITLRRVESGNPPHREQCLPKIFPFGRSTYHCSSQITPSMPSVNNVRFTSLSERCTCFTTCFNTQHVLRCSRIGRVRLSVRPSVLFFHLLNLSVGLMNAVERLGVVVSSSYFGDAGSDCRPETCYSDRFSWVSLVPPCKCWNSTLASLRPLSCRIKYITNNHPTIRPIQLINRRYLSKIRRIDVYVT